MVEYQMRVFKHFGLHVNQVLHEWSHGEALNRFLNNDSWSKIAIFDIDCIPLHRNVLLDAENIVNEGWLYGAAQKANHIKNSQVYCSPAFCCFSREAYEKAGKPTFKETTWHDVGGHFTNELIRVGYRARLLWPVDVENPVWDLEENVKFGHGTNYQNTVYHAFESRFNHESTSRFITKCKEILGE